MQTCLNFAASGAQSGQVVLDAQLDGDVELGGPVARDRHAIVDHGGDVDLVLVQRQLAAVDFDDLEDVGDGPEKLHAAVVDVADILLVPVVADLAVELVAHDLGKTEDRGSAACAARS